MHSRFLRLERVKRRAVLDVASQALLYAFAVGCGEANSVDADLDSHRRLRGELVHADTSSARSRGRYVMEHVRLESSSGLVATGSVVRPRTGSCFAAVLLQDGREENSGVMGRLPLEFGDVVVLSL